MPLSFFDDVIEAQTQVLCFKLTQAPAADDGSPAIAQLTALLREWADETVGVTLANIAAKAQEVRTRLRAFVLVGQIFGLPTRRFVALALERADCDAAVKVRQLALQRISELMPSVVDNEQLRELTPAIGKKLVDIACKDASNKMRAAAVRVLGESFEPNRSIVSLVVARVNDKDAAVRAAACETLKALPFDVVSRFVTWPDWTQLLACAHDSDDAVRAVLDTLFVGLLRHQLAGASDRRQVLIETLASLRFVENDHSLGDMVKRHIGLIEQMMS